MIFQHGDIVRSRIRKFPLIYHYGIILKKDNCQDFVIHNPMGGKPTIDYLEDFVKDRRIDKYFNGLTNHSYEELIHRFLEIKDKEFNLLIFNCEDFVNLMIGKKEFTSAKIYFVIVCILVILMIVLLSIKISR